MRLSYGSWSVSNGFEKNSISSLLVTFASERCFAELFLEFFSRAPLELCHIHLPACSVLRKNYYFGHNPGLDGWVWRASWFMRKHVEVEDVFIAAFTDQGIIVVIAITAMDAPVTKVSCHVMSCRCRCRCPPVESWCRSESRSGHWREATGGWISLRAARCEFHFAGTAVSLASAPAPYS